MAPQAQPLPPMDMATNGAVLPPVNAPGLPGQGMGRGGAHAAGESQMTLVSPTGTDRGGGLDWAKVLGISLIAEVGLLWLAACLGLWRRRAALARAGGARWTASRVRGGDANVR